MIIKPLHTFFSVTQTCYVHVNEATSIRSKTTLKLRMLCLFVIIIVFAKVHCTFRAISKGHTIQSRRTKILIKSATKC